MICFPGIGNTKSFRPHDNFGIFDWQKLRTDLSFRINLEIEIILKLSGRECMSIIEQINSGIKEAIRSRDSLRLDTLRMLKSRIMTVDARANLPDAEVVKLFKTYFGNLQEALEQAQKANRPEIVERLKGELLIVQEFLPKTLSPEETKKIVLQAIANSGAKTKKELGIVMKNIMQLNLPIDAKLAKDLASELLAD
jgi:uncharacterized protein